MKFWYTSTILAPKSPPLHPGSGGIVLAQRYRPCTKEMFDSALVQQHRRCAVKVLLPSGSDSGLGMERGCGFESSPSVERSG